MPDPVVVEATIETPEQVAAPTPLADVESLTEYRERRSKGEEPGETPEVKTEEKVETKAEVVAEPDAASKAGKELAAKRGSLQARIDELTRDKHTSASETATARAEAAALKAELAALKSGKPAETKPEPKAAVVDPNDPEPDIAKYDDYTKYTRELARWEARQELKAARAETDAASRTTAAETARATVMAKGAEAFGDFQEKVAAFEAAGGQYAPAAVQVILRHEMGHAFAYAYVSDPAIAARIDGADSPYAAMLEAGAVVAELKAAKAAADKPKPKPVSKAPAPVEPVAGESVESTPDPANMSSVTEWRKQRAKFMAA
jgi:hypothetical protein